MIKSKIVQQQSDLYREGIYTTIFANGIGRLLIEKISEKRT